MHKRIGNLHSSLERFVDALLKYQTSVVEINRAAQRQLRANDDMRKNLKSIASVFRVSP
ncbi:hypothetical protein [Propionivibrio dicarboxylicus]|uniref:Uncharacterized protein n=1 Tax=Propionivibrio dicarboxylicus TaxID=83767 RepID=A0A1G8GTF4_9RHOO|nr:hypothetical protein [Propionivibrio dicarboxylicus]SDH97642.1 hypothetical protein SAMN05660652_02631 [Propionivibrio dicarboxylicus]